MESNQNPEVIEESSFDDEGLFDDLVDEEFEDTPAEDTEATEESQEKETNKETEAAPTEPFLKVKYNKEEKGLTREEATELAQKGMNYDNVFGKYNTLNSQLDRLAKLNGMDVNEYLEHLEEVQVQFQTNKELETLRKKYPDAEDELLQEIAESRVRSSKENETKEAEKQQQEIDSKEIEQQVAKFNKRYPNLKADELDPKVYDLMQEGYTLLEAYNVFKDEKEAEARAKQEAQQQVAKKNAENIKRSFGNISTTGGADYDDFMSGFLSD